MKSTRLIQKKFNYLHKVHKSIYIMEFKLFTCGVRHYFYFYWYYVTSGCYTGFYYFGKRYDRVPFRVNEHGEDTNCKRKWDQRVSREAVK